MLGDLTLQLEEALCQASNLNGQLQSLLKQLEKMKAQLVDHKPPRVQPAHIDKQLKDLSVGMACITLSLFMWNVLKKHTFPFPLSLMYV